MNSGYENFDYLFKIVLVGDTNVGKTNILSYLINEKCDKDAKPTIGVEFGTKFYNIEQNKIKTQIWDTAGQERYHAIISAYYRGANGAVVVYDISNKKSYENALDVWLKNVQNACPKDMPIIFFANKIDLKEKEKVKSVIARDKILKNNCGFFETSAFTGQNILEAFDNFIQKIYQNEKGKNNLKNKRYARREDLKGEELALAQKSQKRGCC